MFFDERIVIVPLLIVFIVLFFYMFIYNIIAQYHVGDVKEILEKSTKSDMEISFMWMECFRKLK